MFLSVRRCAEYMTQVPRLKVTDQGQGIYPWILCPLHISWTLRMISFNFTQMFLSVWWCAKPMSQLHRLKVTVTLQGNAIYHSIHVSSKTPESFERFSLNFTQMFLSVRGCARHMTQLPRLKVKRFTLEFCVRSISRSWNLRAIFIKLLPNVLSETMSRFYYSAAQTWSRSCD